MMPLSLEQPVIKPLAALLSLAVTLLPGALHSGLKSPPAYNGPIFFAIDALMLAALPILRLSWGPVMPPLAAMSSLRTAIMGIIAALFKGSDAFISASLIIHAGLSVLVFYGLYIENNRIAITRKTLAHPAISSGEDFTILHLADLHFEHRGRREEKLLGMIDRLSPDVIVFSGDFINLSFKEDQAVWREIRDYLSRWKATGGVYIVSGTPLVESNEAVAAFVDGLGFRWLRNETCDLAGQQGNLTLTGITCTHNIAKDSAVADSLLESLSPEACNILLYHSPDIADVVAKYPVDLMLCGHTHGGQIRLPLIGPLITSSALGRRYVMGEYPMGRGRLYVSRGIGLEGASAPRARLLCPPEIILWQAGK